MKKRFRGFSDDTFSSLKVRNFKLFFGGQLISQTGTWLTMIAQTLLVLQLTDSGIALGILTACQFLPVLLLGAWAGTVADRADKRKLLMTVQALAMLQSVALAVTVWSGNATVGAIYVLAACQGVLTAFDNPTRRSFVVEMVPPDEVTNAVSLNSAVMTGSRVVGPALAGVLVITVGFGWAFMIDAISYLAVLAGLFMMRTNELYTPPRTPRAKGQVREGLRYIRGEPDIRSNLILTAVVGLFAYNFPVVLPVLAKEVFGGGAGIYSLMNVAAGLGALLGGLLVASRATASPRQLLVAVTVLAGVTCATAVSPTLPVLFLMLGVTGGCNVAVISTSNAMLQLVARETMRGRVLAIRAITVVGGMAFGGPITGAVTDALGPRWGLTIGGLVTFGAAGWYAMNLRRRASLPDLVPVTADPASAG
jgi:MFS family permease